MVEPEELTTDEVLAVARERLVTTPVAAEIMESYTVRIRRLLDDGRLQGVKVGTGRGTYLVDRKAVERLREELDSQEGDD